MVVRTRYLLAAVLGMCAAHFVPAQEPGRLGLDRGLAMPAPPTSGNEQLAAAVARQLKQSGQLNHYCIDLACRAGVVEVSGVVNDRVQRDAALRLIQSVVGVERVLDRLTLRQDEGIVRAQAEKQLEGGAAAPEAKPAAPVADPLPLLSAPGLLGGLPSGNQADLNPPKMPPYAWPTYSPYPNFSRVAYPLAYPYNAWPYIGPIYPFPKVPLGWRSVKLEFDEGYWWFSRTATKHDWWRLRVW